MKSVTQLSLFLENKPGRVYQIFKTLGEAGINIFTISLADTNQFGILRLIVEDAEATGDFLVQKGYAVTKTKVLAIRIDDKPGTLAHISELLSEAGVNVEYAYAFALRNIFIYRVSDNETAYTQLATHGFDLLNHDELFKD